MIYDAFVNDLKTTELNEVLFYTASTLSLPAVFPNPTPILTVLPARTLIPTKTLAATPTAVPTPVPSTVVSGSGGTSPGIGGITLPNSWTGLVLGVGLVGIIVVSVLGLMVWKARSAQK